MVSVAAYGGSGGIGNTYRLPYITTDSLIDPRTGQPLLLSGFNVRTIVPEMYRSSVAKMKSNYANNATNTIYNVPAGKNFFLTAASIQISFQAASFSNEGGLDIDSETILRGFGSDVAGAYSMSESLPSIIVLSAGQQIKIRSESAKIKAVGCIFGYEIDSSEFLPLTSVTK